MKRILAMLLCVIMVVGLLPATAFATETATATDTAPVIIAMSDYQNSSLSSSSKKTVPQTIVNAMVAANVDPELALIGGDYTDGSVGADGDNTSEANLKTELGNLTGILTSAWSGLPYYAIQGNHDYSGFLSDGTLTKTGAYEKDEYIVYLINEDDFPWWQGNYGSGSTTAEDKETVTATTSALSTYLNSLISSGDTRPVIIMSHVPMHWSERSTAANWYYDNIYANILFEAVNKAAEDLDILFLFGHNHSHTASGGDYDYEIGGALAYVAAGESMKVPNGKDGASNYTTEELNFTYMNAGYVGVYAGDTSNCSVSAIEIADDAINIDRYTYNGKVYEETIELKNIDVQLRYLMVEGTTTYSVGDELTFTSVTGYDSDAEKVPVDISKCTVEPACTAHATCATVDAMMDTVADSKGDYHQVKVSYNGVSATYSFTVSEPVKAECTGDAQVEVSGVSAIGQVSVTDNTAANAEVAASLKADAYVSYDITPSGALNPGNWATVSVPMPAGWTNAKCYYIPESGAPQEVKGTFADGVFTFRTNHFSTWLFLTDAQEVASDWVELPSGSTVYYEKVNSMTAGQPYVITNTGNSYALNRNSTSAVNGSGVTVTDNGDDTYSIATVSDAMVWYLDEDDHLYTVNNGTKYYLNGTYSSWQYSMSVSTAASDAWSASNSRISSRDIRSNRTVYLTVGSSIGGSTTATTLNIYQQHTSTTTGGYARLNGYLTQSYDLSAYEIASESDVLSLASIQLSQNGSTVSDTVALTADMVTWDKTFDGSVAGTYTATVTYEGKTLGTITVNVTGELVIDDSWVEIPEIDGFLIDNDGVDYGSEYLIVSTLSDASGGDANAFRHAGYHALDSNAATTNSTSGTSPVYGVVATLSGSGNSKVATIDEQYYGTAIWTITEDGIYNRDGLFVDVSSSAYSGAGSYYNMAFSANSNRDWTIGRSGNYYTFTTSYNGSSYKLQYNSWRHSYMYTKDETSNLTYELYKVTTGSGKTYAKLTGETEQSYSTTAGATVSTVLGKVSVLTSSNGHTVSETVAVTSGMVTWDKAFDGSTAGTYTGTVTYNGQTLGKITVKVEDASIKDMELTEPVGSVIRDSSASTTTGGKLKVYYTNGTSEVIDITLGMVNNDATKQGTFTGLTVTHNGKTVDGFTLNVLPVPGNDYPEYPNKGAVKVNKTADASNLQEQGVVKVELTTSGITLEQGVDVVIIVDTSSSMDDDITYNGSNVPRYDVLNASLADMLAAMQQTSGQTADMDIAIAEFNGYTVTHTTSTLKEGTHNYINTGGSGGIYGSTVTPADGVMTGNGTETAAGFTPLSDFNVNTANDTIGTGNSNTNISTAIKSITSGTNYDRGLQMAYDLLAAKKASWAEGETRQQYAIFMTDGIPYQYNGVVSYYTATDWAKWLGADYTSTSALPSTIANKDLYYNDGVEVGSGQPHYTAEAIKGNGTQHVVRVGSNGAAYLDSVEGLGATMYTIGFGTDDSDNPAYLADPDNTVNILKKMATDEDKALIVNANEADNLPAAFAKIANAIKLAATEAYFVDQMGDSFDLQMSNVIDTIDITGNDVNVTLNPAPEIVITKYTLNADGSRNTASGAVQEKVTFDATGEFAKSTVASVGPNGEAIAAGSDILIDGVIYAKNFWYNSNSTAVTVNGITIPAETFRWNIGDIDDAEWSMTYFAYLTGSMEGKASSGSYKTNKYATLYYKNWLGNDAQLDTTSPQAGWKAANVSYAFYLVDQNGNPVVNQTTGQTGTFYQAVKVTQPVVWEEIMLNNLDDINTIEASSAAVLPDGYDLYDPSASYKVVILSAEGEGSWTITYNKAPGADGQYGTADDTEITDDSKKIQSTYVTGHYGTEATNAPLITSTKTDADGNAIAGVENHVIPDADYDYTHTTVWFAVVWVPSAMPDTVVVDYGLPVDISVMVNDQFGENGKLNGIGTADEKSAALNGTTNIYTDSPSNAFGAEETLDYGTAKVNGSKVTYTPRTMDWKGDVAYDRFAYEVEYDWNQYDANGNFVADKGTQYYYGDVTVIPATTVYYEDNFTETDGTSYITYEKFYRDGSKDESWDREGTPVSGVNQAEDRPGKYSLAGIDANNVYGYDGAYSTMSAFSMGSAAKVHVDKDSYATATFDFYGSGLDIISMTSNTTGTLILRVYDEAGNIVANKTVDTYYGYKYENGEWVVDTKASDSLYQIPVLKVELDDYAKYRAVLSVSYFAAYDHNTTEDGYDFYLDGIRIYDPAGLAEDLVIDKDGTANDVSIADIYAQDNEGWPRFEEIRNQLISEDTYKKAEDNTSYQGAIFIDGNDENLSVADYTNYGPNNELYLDDGQSVAFELDLSDYIVKKTVSNVTVNESIVADVQLGVKSADGSEVKVTLTADSITSTRSFTTTSEMYYSFQQLVDMGTDKDEVDAQGNVTTKADPANDSKTVVTITNSGASGIVSITNLKITFKENPLAAGEAGVLSWSPEVGGRALMMLSRAPAVEETPEETVPETTVPEETVPETTVPEETEPETTVPEVTEPEETVPETTVPEETQPEEPAEDPVQQVINTVKEKVTKALSWLFSWMRR